MIRNFFSALLLISALSYGAQGSGIYFQAHFSQGKSKGDGLVHFVGQSFGYIRGDSIYFPFNDKGLTDIGLLLSQVDFQYAVRHSFLVGYEKSFNKILSLRGAVGYQYALMEAFYEIKGSLDSVWVTLVDAQIDRHWLTIPIEFKVTLPIRRGGLFVAMGPKSSILLSSEYSEKINNSSQDLTDFTPRFNLGLGFRIGTELAIAKIGFLLIESGYNWGLLNTAIVSEAKSREGEFSLFALGFRVNFPKK